MQDKKRVLLLFGGESSEHEVSISSAKNVFSALNKQKFEVTLCFIDKSGKWWLADDVDDSTEGKSQLLPVLGTNQFATLPFTKLVVPDVILPILHGKHGEDGTVQGLASLMHIPIVGPSLVGAAITMDKEVTKRLLKAAGIPVVDWELYYSSNPMPEYSLVSEKLGNTVFVKPANAGSSVGVSKVTDEDSFKKAFAEAAKHDEKILVEKAVQGRELEIAVLGNSNPNATVAGEIKPGDEFYSYDAKYSPDSKSEAVIPAEGIDDETQEKLKALAVKAYQTTENRGMARVDFFMLDSGEIYVNEINSIPGFTNISMYPKLWQQSGLSYSRLIEKLIELALE